MKRVFLLLFLTFINLTFSQSTSQEKVTNFINSSPYFTNNHEELFFLHTNKSVYFSGEDIWFAAYVLDKLNEVPSEITKNLHLNLYNSSFNLVDSKLYHVNKGKTFGQFGLSENLSSGIYYIELDTNWNKNFKKGTVTKIEIINLKAVENNQSISNDSIEEVQNFNESLPRSQDHPKITRNLTEYNSTLFYLTINKELYQKYNGEPLFVVLHKDRSINSCALIEVGNKKRYPIKFAPEFLSNGANTITIFDTAHTIITKKTFWNYNSKLGTLEITKNKKTKDSLFLNLRVLNSSAESRLSISILDTDSEINTEDQTILSSFLDADYTEILLHQKNNTLDAFLNKKAFPLSSLHPTHQYRYKNETGIRIKGKVNSTTKKLEKYKIMLSSKENELFEIQEINKDLSFEFENLYLTHPSNFTLSLINKKSETIKGSFYIFPNYYHYKPNKTLEGVREEKLKIDKDDPVPDAVHSIRLEEDVVELEAIEFKTVVDKEKEIRKKYENTLGAGFTEFYIPDENLAAGTDIFEYLGNVPGLRVVYVPLSNAPLIFSTRGAKSITGSQIVNVKLNGIPLGEELDPLVGFRTSDFEVIMVNLSGAGEGQRGANGVVNLIQKNVTNSKKRAISHEVNQTVMGYEKSLPTFVQPRIKFNDEKSLKAYGVIDWIPNFKLSSNTTAVLKIPFNTNQKNTKLSINGFNDDGLLIHTIININDAFK